MSAFNVPTLIHDGAQARALRRRAVAAFVLALLFHLCFFVVWEKTGGIPLLAQLAELAPAAAEPPLQMVVVDEDLPDEELPPEERARLRGRVTRASRGETAERALPVTGPSGEKEQPHDYFKPGENSPVDRAQPGPAAPAPPIAPEPPQPPTPPATPAPAQQASAAAPPMTQTPPASQTPESPEIPDAPEMPEIAAPEPIAQVPAKTPAKETPPPPAKAKSEAPQPSPAPTETLPMPPAPEAAPATAPTKETLPRTEEPLLALARPEPAKPARPAATPREETRPAPTERPAPRAAREIVKPQEPAQPPRPAPREPSPVAPAIAAAPAAPAAPSPAARPRRPVPTRRIGGGSAPSNGGALRRAPGRAAMQASAQSLAVLRDRYGEYMDKVLRRIQQAIYIQQQIMPMMFNQGAVVMTFTIDASGRLQAIRYVASAPEGLVQERAAARQVLEDVRNGEPLPRPTPEMLADPDFQKITINFIFAPL